MMASVLLAASAHGNPQAVVPGQILLQMKNGVDEPTTKAVLAGHAAKEVGKVRQTDVRVVKVPEKSWAKVIQALKKNPKVQFAEPDYVLSPASTPNDPYYGYQWHLPRISAPGAWSQLTNATEVRIGVVDTGVDASHVDLAGRVLPGWNFFDGSADTTDTNGHGTAVAGVAAAALNNQRLVASVAGFTLVVPVRVTDIYGYTSESILASGITFAADQGCRVINVSFNATYSSTVTAAAQYAKSKGAVVVMAAGNGGYFDEAANNPEVITVSASGRDNLLPSWSNRGNNIDLAAPGQDILSITPGNNTAFQNGTSFATPVVAGVAALVTYANPALTPAQVEQVIKETAADFGNAGWDSDYGYGIVNASNAVARAFTFSPSTPTPLVEDPAPVLEPELPAVEEPPVIEEPAGDTEAPTINIVSPTNNSLVTGKVIVTVNASDNTRVARVELWANGTKVGESLTAPFKITFSFPKKMGKNLSLQTVAYDEAGNASQSQVVNVTRR